MPSQRRAERCWLCNTKLKTQPNGTVRRIDLDNHCRGAEHQRKWETWCAQRDYEESNECRRAVLGELALGLTLLRLGGAEGVGQLRRASANKAKEALAPLGDGGLRRALLTPAATLLARRSICSGAPQVYTVMQLVAGHVVL